MTNETTATDLTYTYNINEDIEESLEDQFGDAYEAVRELRAEAPFSDRALDGVPADLDFDDLVI